MSAEGEGLEPDPNSLVEFPNSHKAWLIAGMLACVATAISSYNIYYHLKNYTNPTFQKSIVRIILIIPLYALCSVASLVFPKFSVFIISGRDCYEAYVIYIFLALCLSYAGGDHDCVDKMSSDPGTMHHPKPFCCLPLISLDSRFLRVCKQGAIQFVIMKPTFAALSIFMLLIGQSDSTAYNIIVLVVYNLSYTTAMYVLVLFYLATKKFLVGHKPVRKFVIVKTIVFMTYWQMLMVSVMPGMTPEQGERWNDFILCCEFVPISIVAFRAFPYHEFVVDDSSITTSVLSNVGEVLSVKDVVSDTVHNFKPAYQEYTLSQTDKEAPPKVIKVKTYLVGNLGAIKPVDKPLTGLAAEGEEMGGTV